MRSALQRLWQAPAWIWLAGLSLIFLLRFPVHYLLYPPYLMDFEVYRAVAVRIAHGGAAHLYDPTTSSGLMLFKYAPCWALFMAPLGWMSTHTGAVLWAILTVAWLLTASWGASRLCQEAGLQVPGWAAAVTISLLVRPITSEFLNGQVDLLWALLVIAFLFASVRQASWWAALWLALAISLKLPALIFLASLLVRRRWRAVMQTLAVLLTLNSAAALILAPAHGLQLIQAWLKVLVTSGASRAFEIGNQSLLALAGRFLSADGYRLNVAHLTAPGVVGVTLLVSVLLFGLVCLHPPANLNDAKRTVFDGALLTVLMVLCSPTVWIATYSACILPVMLAIACPWTFPQATWHRLPPTLAVFALILLSAMTHSSFWHTWGVRAFRNESYVYLVLMILPWFGLVLWSYLWCQRRASARLEALRASSGGTSGNSEAGSWPPSAR